MVFLRFAEYDEDDKEADAVWEAVDERMDSRRKDRREARLKEEIEKYRKSNPKITEHVSALDPKSRGVGGTVTDLTVVGEGRGTVLSLKLDRLSDSVSGHTVVDPKGYLTDSVKLWLEAAKLEHDECCPCDQDPHVIAAVARLFWQDRKVDKARSWLNRAVTLAPDVGDFWALYYKFELQHGTEDTQNDVLKRCVAVEPKHGEKWQAVSKAVENVHQPTEAILKKVVIVLGKEEKAAENKKH